MPNPFIVYGMLSSISRHSFDTTNVHRHVSVCWMRARTRVHCGSSCWCWLSAEPVVRPTPLRGGQWLPLASGIGSVRLPCTGRTAIAPGTVAVSYELPHRPLPSGGSIALPRAPQSARVGPLCRGGDAALAPGDERSSTALPRALQSARAGPLCRGGDASLAPGDERSSSGSARPMWLAAGR